MFCTTSYTTRNTAVTTCQSQVAHQRSPTLQLTAVDQRLWNTTQHTNHDTNQLVCHCHKSASLSVSLCHEVSKDTPVNCSYNVDHLTLTPVLQQAQHSFITNVNMTRSTLWTQGVELSWVRSFWRHLPSQSLDWCKIPISLLN